MTRTHESTDTIEYRIWCGLKSRCLNKRVKSLTKHKCYKNITICKRWYKFEAFIQDMGLKPRHCCSIDRLDNTKGYCKENCRWATRLQQYKNRRKKQKLITYKKETLPLRTWAKKLKINVNTLNNRIKRNPLNIEKAFNSPVLKKNVKISYKGKVHSLTTWAKLLGMNYDTLKNRIGVYKWSVKRAFTQKVRQRYI